MSSLKKKLTKRDIEIVKFVFENKFLLRSQIERLFFSQNKQSRVICNRRLRKLEKLQLIKRFKLSLNEEAVISPGFFLSTLDKNNYYYRLPNNYLHYILRNEVYVLLKETPYLTIDTFLVEYVFKQNNYTLQADILTIVKYKNKVFSLIIEVDTGTESLKILKEKLNVYNHLKKHFSNFPELIIFTTDMNIKRLLRIEETLYVGIFQQTNNFQELIQLPTLKTINFFEKTLYWNI